MRRRRRQQGAEAWGGSGWAMLRARERLLREAVAEDPEPHQPLQLSSHKKFGRAAGLGIMNLSPKPGWR